MKRNANLQPRGAFVKVKMEKNKCGTKFEQGSQNTSSSLLALTFTLPYTYHVTTCKHLELYMLKYLTSRCTLFDRAHLVNVNEKVLHICLKLSSSWCVDLQHL